MKFDGKVKSSLILKRGSRRTTTAIYSRYGYNAHIRGPDGPRGGVRTLCGSRVPPVWDRRTSTMPADAIKQCLKNGRASTRLDGWYTYNVCLRCAKEWIKSLLSE